MQLALKTKCRKLYFAIIIDFYAPLLGREVHKSFMNDIKLIFMQLVIDKAA